MYALQLDLISFCSTLFTVTSKPFNVHFGSPAYTELIENVSETNIPSEPLQVQPVSKFLPR